MGQRQNRALTSPITHRLHIPMKLISYPTLLRILFGTLLILAVSGCHTANGFGKDVERTGEKIQENTK